MSDYKLFSQVSNRIKEEKTKLLSTTSKDFQNLVNVIIHGSSVTDSGLEKKYKEALKKDIPSAFFRKYEKDLKKAIKPDLIPLFYYEIDNVRLYQYDNSIYRRNFRSNDYRTYIKAIHGILVEFIVFSILNVDMNDYLLENTSEEINAYKNYCYGVEQFPFIIAALIDNGDQKIRATIEDIVLNNGGRVSTEIIRGIFVSKDPKMYELMEKLLLAARLQEGLRQAVCECMDFGTREAFDYMFKVILDNDLQRFSSVQRAIEVTTGLVAPDEKGGDRITKKQCALIHKYLTEPSERDNAFASDDHMEIYLALWAIGTERVEDAFAKAEDLIYNGGREQRVTAAFFLANFCYDSNVFMRIFSRKKDEPEIIALTMSRFMGSRSSAMMSVLKEEGGTYREYVSHRVFANPAYYFEDEKEAREAYFILKDILALIPNKKLEYNGLVFPWVKVALTKTDCVSRMAYCASASMDKTLTLEAARDIASVEKWEREEALALLLTEPENREEYEILTRAMGDGEERTRDRANRMLTHELKRDTTYLDSEIRASEGKLPSFCYEILEDMLRLKRSDMRQNVINMLMTMDDEDKISMFERLLSDKAEEKRTAALDMILLMKKDNSPSFAKAAEKTAVITSPTTQEQVLLDEITGSSDDHSDDAGEGRGLFDPTAEYEPVFDMELIENCNKVWDRVFPNKKIGKKLFSMKTKTDELKIFKALDDLIEKNKELEYEVWGDKKLLGNGIVGRYIDGKKIIPFPELWDSFYEKSVKTEDQLVRLSFMLSRGRAYGFDTSVNGYKEFCDKYAGEYFGAELNKLDLKDYKHSRDFSDVITYMCDKHDISEIKSDIGRAVAYHIAFSDDPMIFSFTKKDIAESRSQANLKKENFTRTPLTDGRFSMFIGGMFADLKSFPIRYALVRKFGGSYSRDYVLYNYYTVGGDKNMEKQNIPTIEEYIAACAGGLISKDFLYKRIFDGFESETLRMLSAVILFIRERNDAKTTRVRRYYYRGNYASVGTLLGRKNIREEIDPDKLTDREKATLDLAEECFDTLVSYCVGKELKRGDSPTEYSCIMKEVGRLYGLNYFVGILKAFGKSTFNRSKYLSYRNSDTKEDVLSHLLGVCVPDSREGDVKEQAAKLKAMIKGTDIKEKRLIEAGLFAPEWLDIIGELLQIPGFHSGCYYFMAHMNEKFDEKRKAVIAKYSPLSEDEFNAGAFDKSWFDEVYGVLGEKKFEEIYDAAKYISDGAKHARGRKYADAATGKLDPKKTRDEIEKKRNKDLLMAYAILNGTDEEIRERYSYIRQFIKESKKFGAQRRASEKLAGETAIKNMATAQGYPDETRFILKMENDIASELAGFWEMQKIGDVEMCLVVDSGKVDIRTVKGGKELKSIPAALKKNEQVLDLQEAKKTFTEQYRRTRIMLEEAMESRTPFLSEEIEAMRMNPVLTGMIDSLVFESEGKFGLRKDLKVKKGGEVFVAHPYTMFKAGTWKDMQALIFENEIAQPFKQVFRELYVKTEEEINALDSRRYAGNQIQTKMTVGVLKNRRWVADVEDGLQKVYYKENIIATIFALADWFSPSDVEAPTLEWVAFFDRKTGEAMQIKDVPDILFSEVMRDVDLAVSVAHAGEVDPEMSHSTIEMRRAVAEFTCKSFKLGNVSFTDSHAIVKGKRANYTIHLGSGIIHLEGGLMINVLPVHSQKRGRIFLPFVDDDPKTAEVISKILLFAEDNKIKDPFILNQIV